MIKLSSSRLLALMCFILSTAIFSSCNKNDNPNSGKVELLSFGPTGSKHGDTLRFIGNNLNKVSAIQFTGVNATVEQKDFKQQRSDLILLIVPQAAEKGYVTLKTPDGDIRSKTQLNLNVLISVTAVTPHARPGESITITGDYLNWVNRVTFYKDKVAETFVSQSINQLVVKVPDDAQTGLLVLHYTGTDSAELETTDTLKVTLPMVTSVSPNPAHHGEELTINGTDLDLVRKLYFTGVSNAIPASAFITQGASEITLLVPPGTKKGKITLEAASGVQTTSAVDLDVVLPSVTTMSPNPVDPGADLTITGTNLDLVTSVKFENASGVSSFVSQSATQLVVTVPPGVTRGKITLSVVNSTLTVQSNDVLEITGAVPPPTIAFPFYNDAVTSNWNGWIGGGWGGTTNYSNASPVREGSKSIAINYVGGWGAPLQLGGASINLSGYSTFKISVFGAPGSGGKTVSIAFNQTNNKYNIQVIEGA
ncbi:MAG TPA: IPT/TIG domain-containing protein, partial [Chitinophagaceae bacterium]|nr:IPT/TIG domain-containing protein [Chitinophagaceae bacterium]